MTTWSKLGVSFSGVSVDVLLDAVQPHPEAGFVMATSTTGYTTNLPLDDVRGGKAWVVWTYEGQPLPTEHGGPIGDLRSAIEQLVVVGRSAVNFSAVDRLLKQAVERFALTFVQCAEHLVLDRHQRNFYRRELLRAGISELDQVPSPIFQ